MVQVVALSIGHNGGARARRDSDPRPTRSTRGTRADLTRNSLGGPILGHKWEISGAPTQIPQESVLLSMQERKPHPDMTKCPTCRNRPEVLCTLAQPFVPTCDYLNLQSCQDIL
jgi:hypothetical protein